MINPALVKLLSAACAVLVVIIAGEWWYWEQANDIPAGEAQTLSTDYEELTFPQFQSDRPSEERYNDLVSRPLFIEGRRPAPEPDPDLESASETSSETLDWELTGIYTVQQKPHVLLRRIKPLPDQKNHKKMPVEEDVDGWRLVEILPDKAIFERGMGRQELILRKPKQKEPTSGRRPLTPPKRPAAPKLPSPASK
ncbi:hypothetical protein [Methylotuvimicrobium alcaliphilum]|uniref:Type II secretion system protein GspC N-terminal domain-containing protein n=1 Tax=Methylotuvimicrobium alcaliphilum (strain DSM 19304 / NCIMB 14124 / VKM B-2133 / 20Z) TaxID=1091494 RepID=G4T157_META2|nr:hypothetical protein [Methylotuvimicrobium alcaliphilum]CCE24588.1 conserved protein of unknown function [Methylotuvimicrobium alcaliphilum 20Z]